MAAESEPTPLIFVAGVPFSGKSYVVDKITLEHLPPVIAKLGRKTIARVKFPSDYLAKVVGEIGKIFTPKSAYEAIAHKYVDIIEKTVKDNPKSIVVVENNPLYLRELIGPLMGYIRPLEVPTIGGHPDNAIVDRLGSIPTYALFTIYIKDEIEDSLDIVAARFSPSGSADKASIDESGSVHTSIRSPPDYPNLSLSKRQLLLYQRRLETSVFSSAKNNGLILVIEDLAKLSAKPPRNDIYTQYHILPSQHRRVLMSIDGNIGSGKTTIINKFDIGSVLTVTEPSDDVRKIMTFDLSPSARPQIKEEAFSFVMTREVSDTIKLNKKSSIFVERNLVYANWVFDDRAEDVPTPDAHFLTEMDKIDVWIDRTLLVDVDGRESYDRMVSRGEAHDKKWNVEDLLEIDRKLSILYRSPYQWEYACAELVKNERK
jgi:hypothetical protein